MLNRRDFLKVSGIAVAAAALGGCGGSSKNKLSVGVPNDTTNEARALTLLEKNGFFTLKEGAGITATTLQRIPTTSRSMRWRLPSCPMCCRMRIMP